MISSSTPMIPVRSQTVRRRRWLRGAFLLLALAIAAVVILLTYAHFAAQADWAAAEAEAGQDDPRWRLMEIEADRPAIADAENSALHIIAVHSAGRGVTINSVPNYDKIFAKLPPTARLNDQQIQLIRGELAKIAKPLQDARLLKGMPRGCFAITYSDDVISTAMPDIQNVRNIADWLVHDAWLLAQEEQYDQAVESCHGLMNAGNAAAESPFLIAHLVRLAVKYKSVTCLERVLAQGEPSDEQLAAMQTLLEREIQENGLLAAMRSERAGLHHLFENLRAGKVPMSRIFGIPGVRKGAGNLPDTINDWYLEHVPGAMLKYYPDYLRSMNRGVAITRLPIHERDLKMQEWENSVKTTKNPVIRIFMPSITKVHHAVRRIHALLRTALVALACERYRRKREEWPASLDVLVKEKFLAALPTDPVDNQPLRYRRHAEGIVVYSIGFDLVDNHGHIDRDKDLPYMTGVDTGFRLWNVDRRRQAPLPPVALGE